VLSMVHAANVSGKYNPEILILLVFFQVFCVVCRRHEHILMEFLHKKCLKIPDG
jgi:hypothetical protein